MNDRERTWRIWSGLRRMVCALVCVIVIPTLVRGEPLPSVTPESVGLSSERLERIGPVMQAYVDSGWVSGITTAIVRKGKVAYFESVGLRDIEGKRPMERDTIFRIYSMTKAVTTVAAMMLYEEGAFELNEPVGQFIPAFKHTRVYESGSGEDMVLVEPKRPIRVHDLMLHTSGLGYGWGRSPVDSLYRAADLWGGSRTLRQLGDTLAGLPLKSHPGDQWHYGTSTDVLGLLVEVVSGQPLEDFLRERLFEPLEMVDTGFYVPAEKLDRFAHYYRWKDNQLQRIDNGDPPGFTVPPKAPSGGGGLVSTVDDYLRFTQMILNGGELDGVRILGKSTVDYVLRDHLPPDLRSGRGAGFALGFGYMRDPAAAGRIGDVGEVYWSGIANTFYTINPARDLVYMVWTQLRPHGIRDFRHQIHPLVHGALLD